jgi:hypothetical protein
VIARVDHGDRELIQMFLLFEISAKDYMAWEVPHLDRSFVLNSNSILIFVTAHISDITVSST